MQHRPLPLNRGLYTLINRFNPRGLNRRQEKTDKQMTMKPCAQGRCEQSRNSRSRSWREGL